MKSNMLLPIVLILSSITASSCDGVGQSLLSEEKKYTNITVVYKPGQAASGTAPVDANYYNYKDEVTVIGNTGELLGGVIQDGITRTFVNWNTKANGSGTAYAGGDTFVMGTADVTLYAQYTTTVLRSMGPAGGTVFYDKGSYTNGWRYMEVSKTDWRLKTWGLATDTVGCTDYLVGTGASNTAVIVDFYNETSYSDFAAQLCDQLMEGGYDDWFLPSKYELNLIYGNLVLYRVGSFCPWFHWSSSENSVDQAWSQDFRVTVEDDPTITWSTPGLQVSYTKSSASLHVRAVRVF